MNEAPKTFKEKMKDLPKGACNAGILDSHCGVKKSYLFYYEDALDAWCPAPDKVENIVSIDSGDVGDEIEIKFKIVEMSDAEYEAMPVD